MPFAVFVTHQSIFSSAQNETDRQGGADANVGVNSDDDLGDDKDLPAKTPSKSKAPVKSIAPPKESTKTRTRMSLQELLLFSAKAREEDKKEHLSIDRKRLMLEERRLELEQRDTVQNAKGKRLKLAHEIAKQQVETMRDFNEEPVSGTWRAEYEMFVARALTDMATDESA